MSLPDDFDFDAEFAKAFGSEPPARDEVPTRPKSLVAVVLTPVSSAPALAGLCAMAGIEAHVVPTSRGALAVRVIERSDPGTEGADDDSLAELLGEAPEIARKMAATLSRTSRYGAVLLVSRLGEGDEGLVGTIAASQWNNGERTEDTVSAGLVLAQSDDVVEQLLFGTLTPEDAAGAIEPGKLPPWQARRLFRKTQRKPRP
ncbi:hypothetical protein [Pseudactinotalea suaedae]|uniref:hypothetical protein n=1 Tax=Pseudactinotalea suaedae TaxID=1524924 RepID=UPI0012E1134B|nr:hypothetical protein [Pseudactinotalea suaedae]